MHQPVSPYMPSSLLTAADHRHIAAQLNPVMDAAPVPAQPPMAHLAFLSSLTSHRDSLSISGSRSRRTSRRRRRHQM